MTRIHAGFAAVALMSLACFISTPTWPCAVVVIVALGLTFALEVAREFAAAQVEAEEEEALSALAVRMAMAEECVMKNNEALAETRARVDSLAGRRAFGG